MNLFELTLNRFCWQAFIVLIAFWPTNDASAWADDLEDVKQFVNATTFAVMKMDTAKLGLPEVLSKTIAQEKGEEIQGANQSAQKFMKKLNDSIRGASLFITFDLPYSANQPLIRLFVKNTPKLDQAEFTKLLQTIQFGSPEARGDYLCWSMSLAPRAEMSAKVSPAPTSSQSIKNSFVHSERVDLPKAMQAVSEFPVQLWVLPPEYLWTTVRDLMPTIPNRFGGGPSTLLTEGVRWAALGIDPVSLQLKGVSQSSSAEAAVRTAKHVKNVLPALAGKSIENDGGIAISQLLASINTEVKGDEIHFSTEGVSQQDLQVGWIYLLKEMLTPFTQKSKTDRFKQIGLAIHNYESANKVLPPSKEGRDENGKSLLSWRVHLLPFIGQVELYSRFRLKEPWDSQHNMKLLEKIPDTFKGSGVDYLGSELKPGYTTFLAPTGSRTIFGGTKPVKFSDIRDGLSNTIVLVEVKPEHALAWTAPEDYVFDPANPAQGLLASDSDKPTFLALLGDGSVQQFSMKLPAETVLHLFQMNDGAVINLDP